MANPVHHIHKRKRIHKNLEQYPHPQKFKAFLDKFVYVVAFLGPTMTIAQSHKIWSTGDASGVSLMAWGTYVFGNIVWLMYGLTHKEKPIICMYSAAFVVNVSVVVGIIIHG